MNLVHQITHELFLAIMEKIEGLIGTQKNMEQTIQQLQKEKGQLFNESVETQRALDVANCKKAILEAENSALKDDREELKAEIWNLKKANASLEAENVALKADIEKKLAVIIESKSKACCDDPSACESISESSDTLALPEMESTLLTVNTIDDTPMDSAPQIDTRANKVPDILNHTVPLIEAESSKDVKPNVSKTKARTNSLTLAKSPSAKSLEHSPSLSPSDKGVFFHAPNRNETASSPFERSTPLPPTPPKNPRNKPKYRPLAFLGRI